MEWMFLSCHNYWIVCRLVRRHDGEPFLAYSPVSSIENSSEPFRAFLGAVLSVQNGVPVQTSTFDPEMKLHDITDHGPFPDDDIGLTNVSSKVLMTPIHSRAITSGHTEDPGLLVRPKPDHFLVIWLTPSHSSIRRSLPPFRISLNLPKFGCLFNLCPTHILFHCAPRTETRNDAYC